jgi:hypothetical protein
MPATYDPIATQTLVSAAATVTFSSISGTYTDLVLVIAGSMSGSGNTVFVRFNSDTASNYSATYLGGSGSTAYSGRSSNNTNGIGLGAFNAGYTTGRFNIVAQIQNYSNSTTNKTLISRWSDATSGGASESFSGLWRNTGAITSLEIRNNGGHNFTSGSMFTLYGIKAA